MRSSRLRDSGAGLDLALAGGAWAVAVLLLLGIGVVADAQPEALPDAPGLGASDWWWGLALVTAQALLLGWVRTRPRATLVAVAVAAPVAAAVGLGPAIGATSVAVLVAAYSVVVASRFVDATPALGGAALLVALGELVAQTRTHADPGVAVGSALLQGLGTLAVPAVVATVVRSRRETRTARDEQAVAVGRERAALVEVAVAHERTAMARELHDIAAHHLSGIAVMTGAIGRQIDTDPEGAKAAVEQVREQSRAMLGDMRALVGLLREETPEGTAPDAVRQESLAGIPGLVEAARLAGTDVGLAVFARADGRATDTTVGPLAQLSAYRTVQEALVNVARHAAGVRCEVVVDARDPAVVLVTVVNDPPTRQRPAPESSGGGFGLVGMRERAELTGARLTTGPTPDGGWCVSLAIPTLDQVEGATSEGQDR